MNIVGAKFKLQKLEHFIKFKEHLYHNVLATESIKQHFIPFCLPYFCWLWNDIVNCFMNHIQKCYVGIILLTRFQTE